jgi:hypothetical protein
VRRRVIRESGASSGAPSGASGGRNLRKLTLAEATDALDRNRAGETGADLAAHYGVARSTMGSSGSFQRRQTASPALWLKKAAKEEQLAKAPPPAGLLRSPREALEAA